NNAKITKRLRISNFFIIHDAVSQKEQGQQPQTSENQLIEEYPAQLRLIQMKGQLK
ncbi:17583_t:CDS:2, partial [Funneliformis caledonium]